MVTGRSACLGMCPAECASPFHPVGPFNEVPSAVSGSQLVLVLAEGVVFPPCRIKDRVEVRITFVEPGIRFSKYSTVLVVVVLIHVNKTVFFKTLIKLQKPLCLLGIEVQIFCLSV